VAVAVGFIALLGWIETAMIMTIYLNEAMNKMVENMAIAVRQLPRTSSDSIIDGSAKD
jgi:Cu(I)/Ag(I) efflux system membrane protein CusA/SilA